MKIVFAAMLMLGALGLSKLEPSPSAQPAAAQVAVSSEEVVVPPALKGGDSSAYCPMKWTCNFRSWYNDQATCNANCGSACELEYRCSAGCVCP